MFGVSIKHVLQQVVKISSNLKIVRWLNCLDDPAVTEPIIEYYIFDAAIKNTHCVWYPHDFGGGIRVVEGMSRNEV